MKRGFHLSNFNYKLFPRAWKRRVKSYTHANVKDIRVISLIFVFKRHAWWRSLNFSKIANRFFLQCTTRVHVIQTELYDAHPVLIKLIHLLECPSWKILLKFIPTYIRYLVIYGFNAFLWRVMNGQNDSAWCSEFSHRAYRSLDGHVKSVVMCTSCFSIPAAKPVSETA